jgi:hypothetical protein
MKKLILLIFIIFLSAFLFIGCDGVVPSTPGDEYDEENTELSYLKVLPGSTELKVNQSKKFEVKAYNSDNNLVAIDVTKVKWVATYECPVCGVVWKLSPTKNSLQTTFTALEAGSYEVWAKFEGTEVKWAKANVEVN